MGRNCDGRVMALFLRCFFYDCIVDVTLALADVCSSDDL